MRAQAGCSQLAHPFTRHLAAEREAERCERGGCSQATPLPLAITEPMAGRPGPGGAVPHWGNWDVSGKMREGCYPPHLCNYRVGRLAALPLSRSCRSVKRLRLTRLSRRPHMICCSESDKKGLARGGGNWPLNEAQRPHFRGVRVALGTGYHRVRGTGAA